MSHSFHISLSNILKKLPQTDKYYFYLEPNYRQIQHKLEQITQDLSLITIRCNSNVITLLFEYIGDGYNKEDHEKALNLVKGKYIFLYQHEDPKLKINHNMLRFMEHPDECKQVYLYNESEREQRGNGYLILAPEGENMIYPAMQPLGEPIPPNSLCVLEFTRPTYQLVYLDLKPLGKKPSLLKMNESIMFSVPRQGQPCIMRNLDQIWKEYSKTNPVTTTTDHKKIIQVVVNAVEGSMEQWKAYSKEMPYITQRKTYVEGDKQVVMTTKLPSVRKRINIPGEKLYTTPQYKILTTNERGIYIKPLTVNITQLPPGIQVQNTFIQQPIQAICRVQIQQIKPNYMQVQQLQPRKEE